MQPELTFEEILTARSIFTKHAEDKATSIHQMRSILGDLGQYPGQAEMELVLQVFENKVSFDDLARYLTWLKKRFMKPEPKDADTVRAFVALGGKSDRGGDVNADDLRSACRRFQLTIDIDAMLKEVDEDGSGSIEYSEFRSMWDDDSASGVQFQVEEDAQNENEQLNALREYLSTKAKDQSGIARRQSVIKRKQSGRMDASRKSTIRLPPVLLSASPGKSIAQKNDDKEKNINAEEAESEEEVETPAKQDVKERQNPNANDPIYRRYLMTDPIVVGQKSKTAKRPPATLPPVVTPRTARKASPSPSPRKSTTAAGVPPSSTTQEA